MEDDIKELIALMKGGAADVSGAASTVQGRLLQLARGSAALSQAQDEETRKKRASVMAADSLIEGFRGLGRVAGTVIMSMTTLPSQVASSTDAFTAVKPVVALAASTLSGLVTSVADIGSAFFKLVPFVDKVIGGFKKLATGVIQVVEGAINFQLDATQQLVNNFNSLSKAGLVFGASLEEAKRAATAGGMSLQSFTNVVSNQASNLALLGGNSEQAATLIVGAGRQMSAGLRTIFGGFEGLNTELIETAALQAQLGVRQSRNQTELAASTAPYLLNLKEISLLTGKSAEQTRQEMKQRAQSAAFQNAFAEAGANAQKNLTNTLSQLTPQAASFAQELFAAQAVGADITSKANLQLQALAPQLTDKIRALVALKDLPPEEFRRRQAALLQDIGAAGKDLQKQYGLELFLQSAGRGPELFNLLNTTISEVTSQTNRLANAVNAQADAASKLGKIQNSFSTAIDDVNTELQKLKSGLEDIAIARFKSTTDIVKLSIEGAKLLSQGLDKLSEIISRVVPSAGTSPQPGQPTPPAPTTQQTAPQTPVPDTGVRTSPDQTRSQGGTTYNDRVAQQLQISMQDQTNNTVEMVRLLRNIERNTA